MKNNLSKVGMFFLTIVMFQFVFSAASPIDGFNPSANSDVYSIAVQPDGKIVAGGYFTQIDGQSRNYIARLNVDGTADVTFDPNANDGVYSIAVQPDGKIVAGGAFTTIGGQSRNYIARLNADGSLDTSFNPNANDYVYSIAVQPDGKILVGGVFTAIGGQPRNYIARLNADGTLDTTFNPNADNYVESIAVQTDGKILVGGWFTQIGGQTKNYIARLNADGTLDATFNDPNANNFVRSIAVQPDGKIMVSGGFDTIGGQTRNYIARLNPDGSLDTTFAPESARYVVAMVIQPDGKILVGGYQFLSRLSADYPALQNLNVSADGTTVQWLRSGSGPEVYDVYFEESSDGQNWTFLGNGSRISGGWQLTDLSLPFNQNHYARARGKAFGGTYYGSTSIVESVRMFYNATPYSLIVAKAGTGSGTVTSAPAGINCGSDCTEIYSDKTLITLQAIPDSGSIFAGWSGDCDANGKVLMNSNKSCTAVFNLAVSPQPVPDGTGTTSPVRATKTTSDGSQIQINWDNQCSPQKVNIIYGDLSSLADYAVSGSKCGILNPDTWNIGSTTNIWFVLVSDNLNGTESSWGLDSQGQQRTGEIASGQCGNNLKDNSGSCP